MLDSTTGTAPAADATNKAENAPAFVQPNVYRLHGRELHITYLPVGAGGLSHFTYQDAVQTLNFTGDQVRVVDTEIGRLVSVTIRLTVDSGSTEFTALIPTVNLGSSKSDHIETIGITTIHRFSIVPPLNLGQTEMSSCTRLRGTAAEEIIPL